MADEWMQVPDLVTVMTGLYERRPEKVSARDLAKSVGLPEATVRRALKALGGAGLVQSMTAQRKDRPAALVYWLRPVGRAAMQRLPDRGAGVEAPGGH